MCDEERELWELEFSKRAERDIKWHVEDGTHIDKVFEVLDTIARDPYERSQGYKRLKGQLKKFHERRISKQYRIIYEVEKKLHIVCIISAKDHT